MCWYLPWRSSCFLLFVGFSLESVFSYCCKTLCMTLGAGECGPQLYQITVISLRSHHTFCCCYCFNAKWRDLINFLTLINLLVQRSKTPIHRAQENRKPSFKFQIKCDLLHEGFHDLLAGISRSLSVFRSIQLVPQLNLSYYALFGDCEQICLLPQNVNSLVVYFHFVSL